MKDKIVELLAEMLHRFDVLTSRVDNLTSRVDTLNETLDHRLIKVEDQIVKLCQVAAEDSQALMRLAGHYDDRINRLEITVYKG